MSIENLVLETTPINAGGDDSVLAGIWRKILTDLKVDNAAVYERIERFSKILTVNYPDKTTQVRGNLRNDVNKPGMTWFTFTKCLRMLGVQYFEITFTLHHLRLVSKHTLRVPLSDEDFLGPKEREENQKEDTPSVFSEFFKEIQQQLSIGVQKFEQLLEEFMRREKLVVNLRNKTNIRGYLKKDFSSPRMSWKNFMKAMVFLCVLTMELDITLHFPKGSLTKHKYTVILGDQDNYYEEMKNELGI